MPNFLLNKSNQERLAKEMSLGEQMEQDRMVHGIRYTVHGGKLLKKNDDVK